MYYFCVNLYHTRNKLFSCFSIDVKAEQGSLIAIVGQVGAGKSSLISAILGEMEKIEGSVKVNVSIIWNGSQVFLLSFCMKKGFLMHAVHCPAIDLGMSS